MKENNRYCIRKLHRFLRLMMDRQFLPGPVFAMVAGANRMKFMAAIDSWSGKDPVRICTVLPSPAVSKVG